MLFFSFFFVGFFPFRSLSLVNFHPQKRAKQQQRNSTEVAVDCREINSCTHTHTQKKKTQQQKKQFPFTKLNNNNKKQKRKQTKKQN